MDPQSVLTQIENQKTLSHRVVNVVCQALQPLYYPHLPSEHITVSDMGSFARGTNTEAAPDLDIIFLNAPRTGGYFDWTPIDSREASGQREGFTDLAQVAAIDPRLAEGIKILLPSLEERFRAPRGAARFNFVRTWEGYPGVVFNLSLPHPEFGEIALDIDLHYTAAHFGVEHARRFEAYFSRLLDEQGAEAAARLILDIRQLKSEAKARARRPDGWIDRSRKLPGFVIEGLFMHRYPPLTYAELMRRVHAHRWPPGCEPRDRRVGDQRDPIILAGFDFQGLLENLACQNAALTRGAWEILRQIAHSCVPQE